MSRPTRLSELPARLLTWYDHAARDLPWRIGPQARATSARPDPYRVWLSEIMLQQTTIAHATRYWLDFTARWPDVNALAAAPDSDVMTAWAGLGYYARARNLLKCARVVAARGGFPETRDELAELPGIGPYTAGAIAAIAFGEPVAAVDGNVERVMARILAAGGDWACEKRRIRDTVAALVARERPGEFAEALMDLGATVCTPRSPDCGACPLAGLCAARAEGTPETYPVKPRKAARPRRRGAALILVSQGRVLLERRPASGLLGGMLALPSTPWSDAPGDIGVLCQQMGGDSNAVTHLGTVSHVFTHFELALEVWRAEADRPGDGDWRAPGDVEGLPSVFAKAFALAYPSRPISER